MLQDIAPSRYHVEYTDKQPDADSLCFAFRGREVLEARQAGSFVQAMERAVPAVSRR